MTCRNCGAPEWVRRLDLCAACYLAAGLHLNDLVHRCDKHCQKVKA